MVSMKSANPLKYSPCKTSARPSSASLLETFVLISRPLRYAAILFKPKISPITVIKFLRNITRQSKVFYFVLFYYFLIKDKVRQINRGPKKGYDFNFPINIAVNVSKVQEDRPGNS